MSDKSPRLLPINELRFPEPVTAGMNALMLMSMAHHYRSGNEHLEPIVVDSDLRITDGRHRAAASMIAGRKVVLGEIR